MLRTHNDGPPFAESAEDRVVISSFRETPRLCTFSVAEPLNSYQALTTPPTSIGRSIAVTAADPCRYLDQVRHRDQLNSTRLLGERSNISGRRRIGHRDERGLIWIRPDTDESHMLIEAYPKAGAVLALPTLIPGGHWLLYNSDNGSPVNRISVHSARLDGHDQRKLFNTTGLPSTPCLVICSTCMDRH